MKLANTIVTILPLIQTSEAIYLACCQTTKECPQYYNTIDTFAKGQDTINACCYPDEDERTDDLPECVHPIMTEDGVGISVMAMPSAKLEGGNETLLEEITITEGNEQVSITLTSLEEPTTTEEATAAQDINLISAGDATTIEEAIEISNPAEEATTADETETAPYSCCAVASTTTSLRVTKDPVCPQDMHHVEGVTLNLSLLDAPKTLLCCDSKLSADSVDTASVNLCSEVPTHESTGEDADTENEDVDESKTEVSGLNADDGSSSAGGVGSAAFGIAALCVSVLAVLV